MSFENIPCTRDQALDVIEDALTNLDAPENRGMATGLCGAFYMCGFISRDEWHAYLKRIPGEYHPEPREEEEACL